MIERVDFHDSDAFPCFSFFNLMKSYLIFHIYDVYSYGIMYVLCDILADNNGIKKLQVNINGVAYLLQMYVIVLILYILSIIKNNIDVIQILLCFLLIMCRGCTLITIDEGCCFYGFRTSKIYVQLPQIMLISPPIEPHHIHRTTDANFALALRSGKSFQLEIR
uniref:Uncharacterized protein n=1 Tax=Lactuca sativa TaxID=4236 RepID=A0A9R1XIN1_LACSA|nr:hypothetical protein LSAT_V11C400173550 [Lactuca sativa]